jgi:hypothetical protein
MKLSESISQRGSLWIVTINKTKTSINLNMKKTNMARTHLKMVILLRVRKGPLKGNTNP